MDAVTGVVRFFGEMIGFVGGAFIISAVIVFPIAGIAYLVQRLTVKGVETAPRPFRWSLAIKAWIGFSIVVLALALLGNFLGK